MFYKHLNIEGREFDAEIEGNGAGITVLLKDHAMKEKFEMELSAEELVEIMGTGRDYEGLLRMIRIENGELVLIDYVQE